MRKNDGFDFTAVYDGETVRVVGSVSPYYPAQGPTYSCGGQPAEGNEIEDFRAFDAAGNEIEDADDEMLRALEDEILEHVDEARAEDCAAYAEYRRDMADDR